MSYNTGIRERGAYIRVYRSSLWGAERSIIAAVRWLYIVVVVLDQQCNITRVHDITSAVHDITSAVHACASCKKRGRERTCAVTRSVADDTQHGSSKSRRKRANSASLFVFQMGLAAVAGETGCGWRPTSAAATSSPILLKSKDVHTTTAVKAKELQLPCRAIGDRLSELCNCLHRTSTHGGRAACCYPLVGQAPPSLERSRCHALHFTQ